MKKLFFLLSLLYTPFAYAQSISGMDENGNYQQMDGTGGRFNPHSNDSTKKSKIIPKGLYVWRVDRKLGDIIKAEPDTIPHLFPQSTFASGRYGQYNTTGSNYSPRLSRIFIDRDENEQFWFTQYYDQVQKRPDQWHFTNTLSPITNLTYDNCGDKQNGEDHIDAKFAVNASKQLGMGFDLDYAYARGYYQNQNIAHFNASLYASYLGDKYQMHTLFTTRHQKVAENGGITNDDYVTHPELFSESYSENEIPVVLANNWNRNNSIHFFLTHRYCLGFYRKVRMTDEEIEAKQFAKKSAVVNESNRKEKNDDYDEKEVKDKPMGRPANAKIAGKQPVSSHTDSAAIDSSRIKVDSKAIADSLLAVQAKEDSLSHLMKDEFVPVTSFIHTLELNKHERIYQAYESPTNYYANTFFPANVSGYAGDSIYDQTQHFDIKNTVGLALLEGFNKWAQAGVKVFATHELRKISMPTIDDNGLGAIGHWSEHNISVGGRISKTQGHTLHYNLNGETWLLGEDVGQLKIDFSTDLNFPLFNDTVRLQANAYFHLLNPTFYERHYHSKHIWWDNSLDKITRSRIEGVFAYDKTNTKLRFAIEEIQNYTYFGMSYTMTSDSRTGLQAQLRQNGGNLHVMTAQLEQDFALGPLHWENILTYQNSSSQSVLPVPTFNAFTNLYLLFRVSKVLRVELGSSATYFTKYYAPDYCPQLSVFAVQENAASRHEVGNFPFIDVYANLHLKHARFFFMMSNATATSFDSQYFLTPHYPMNTKTIHMGVSWNFFN